MRRLAFLGLLLVLVLAAPRQAQASDAGHSVSLTFSPIHLALPVVEVTGEVRLPLDFSVAAIAGAGSLSGVSVWEAGAQARYYLLGGFEHGMPVGVEALYVGGADDVNGVAATANGFAVGPFVGYKLATNIGFTLDLGAGVQYTTVSARGTDGTTSASYSSNEFVPLINLNVGWSF